MITLNNSGVSFEKEGHTYSLNGKMLKGVTELLHQKLFPDTYKGIRKEVLAKAAERGTYIHESTELYDAIGVIRDDAPEVKNYARMKEEGGYECIESEYFVTDGENYASAIDAVWAKDGGVYLVDKKTTSKFDADYTSWQLSIYAYMFERLNPDVKVLGLLGCWLRGEKSKLHNLQRHSVDDVKSLLQSGVDGTDFIPSEDAEEQFGDAIKLVERYAELDEQISSLEAQRDEIKRLLFEDMQKNGIDKISRGNVTASVKASYEKSSFDSKMFKTEHGDIYAQYVKQTTMPASIQVRINKAKNNE